MIAFLWGDITSLAFAFAVGSGSSSEPPLSPPLALAISAAVGSPPSTYVCAAARALSGRIHPERGLHQVAPRPLIFSRRATSLKSTVTSKHVLRLAWTFVAFLIGASSSSLASSRFTFPSEDIAVRSAGRRWMMMTR